MARRGYKNQKVGASDIFQTPEYALDPLWQFVKPLQPRVIWEPAAGRGNIVRALRNRGYKTLASDVYPQPRIVCDDCSVKVFQGDFLTWDPSISEVDFILTNPPYSLKDDFILRCYELGKPFALILPLTALEGKGRQAIYRKYGLEVLFMPYRVNYETPSGMDHTSGSSAWFPSAWFTYGLNLPSPLYFWDPIEHGYSYPSSRKENVGPGVSASSAHVQVPDALSVP